MNERNEHSRGRITRRGRVAIGLGLSLLMVACLARQQTTADRHGWWQGLGPVLPHDNFPADCGLCHLEGNWQDLKPDFQFDHEAETGVGLDGAHDSAQCIRCHNDRGPVQMFAERGCGGCHEDIHKGLLGQDCTSCHGQQTWRPQNMIARHMQTRFPLIGVHGTVDCRRCHLGAEVGHFPPIDPECLTCHQDDLNAAVDPPHINLGYFDCDRCHTPTSWDQATFRSE